MGGPCNNHFEGTVFSGTGEGAFYVSIYTRKFLERLGFKPYPGTLNLKLNSSHVDAYKECINSVKPILIEPPIIPGARLGSVYAYKAEVAGLVEVEVYIVRPVITVYKADVVELLSPTHIRSALGLSDGDRVRFKVISVQVS